MFVEMKFYDTYFFILEVVLQCFEKENHALLKKEASKAAALWLKRNRDKQRARIMKISKDDKMNIPTNN